MKGLKKVIAGIGLLISGSIGFAIGNLPQHTYPINSNGNLTTSMSHYLFMFFILIGVILLCWGMFFDKENEKE